MSDLAAGRRSAAAAQSLQARHLLLVIADAETTARTLTHGLRRHGFIVEAITFRAAEAIDRRTRHDLIILDCRLHDRHRDDAILATHALRTTTPIIAVGRGHTVKDRVRALHAGAADVLGPPYSIDELAARVRARLRADGVPPGIIEHGELQLNLVARTVECRNEPLHLTDTEFRLLAHLVLAANSTHSATELLASVWDHGLARGEAVVGVYIRSLRNKFAAVGYTLPLETVRGTGYRFTT